jgi:hypothetical protein
LPMVPAPSTATVRIASMVISSPRGQEAEEV